MGATLPSIAITALQAGMDVARQNAAASAQRDQAKAEMAQIRLKEAAEARARQERLRRVLASQRARFGAQGMSASGSAAAVLAGLSAEAEREATEAAALSRQRTRGIEDQLAWSQRKNLLDASSPQNRMAFTLMQRGVRGLPLL